MAVALNRAEKMTKLDKIVRLGCARLNTLSTTTLTTKTKTKTVTVPH